MSCTSTRLSLFLPLAVAACLACPAGGSLIIYGTQSDASPLPGQSLNNVQLSVDLTVSQGVATMTFTNVSTAGETAVISQIVVDTYDNDNTTTGLATLWDPTILTKTKNVSFSWGWSNGLPGYGPQTRDATPLIDLTADPLPVNGLGPGESLQVQFGTSLLDGSTIFDYLNSFGGGTDTGAFSIGFHAISASAVGGSSLSGTVFWSDNLPVAPTPEPATLGLLALGGVAMLRRRRDPARA